MTPIASPIRFHETSLATGVRLRYADVGRRDGVPVLLLHGYSDSWFSFSPVLAHTPPELRLIIPDQRGHGDSERPAGGYTPVHFAADAIALLDALGIRSAAVVGHSLGGLIGQQLALLAPERVERLVIVASAVTAGSEAVRSLVPSVQSLTDPVDSTFMREFQMSTIYRPVSDDFLNRVVSESLKLPARVWKAILAGMLDLPHMSAETVIQCRASIFWGDRDAVFGRSDQEALQRRLPGAELHVFSDVGHAIHWEVPDEFVRHLITAFER